MTENLPEKKEGLGSPDTLRGFDMLWIFGGDELISALAKVTGWNWMVPIARQMHHVLNFSLVRLQFFWGILAKF